MRYLVRSEAWSHDHFQLEMGLLGSAGRHDERKKLKLKYATFEDGFCRFSEILRIPERSKRGNYNYGLIWLGSRRKSRYCVIMTSSKSPGGNQDFKLGPRTL